MRRRERTLYRILSVGIAVVLWYLVTASQNPEMERVIGTELALRNLPPDLAVVRAPRRVDVRVRAPRAILADLGPRSVAAWVNLADAEPGEHRLPVRVDAPPRVRVVEVVPEQATVAVDVLTQRQLAVEVALQGSTPQGMAVERPEVRPSRVTVSGPRSAVQRARRALASVDLSGVQNTQTVTVRVRILGEGGEEVQGVEVRPPQVQVRLVVQEALLTRLVPVVPEVRASLPAGTRIALVEVQPPLLRVRGPEEAVARLTLLSTEPIEVRDLQGEARYTVRVLFPNRVQPEGPPAVSVRVVVLPSPVTREIRDVPVVVEGLGTGLEATWEPDRVRVRVVGSEEAVVNLPEGEVRAVVDAAGLGPGTARRPVQVRVPQGIWVVTSTPSEVTLRIRRRP
ncbi:MAG: CdaR family protein [Armatimonadota bacterium]|nr:CdaR family protein [Armatimonadota bacterium]MDR7444241.1 CdaR family protein [Armatimonadota bacterium]MDR7570512.1 CdaR family protein [Armatimonadota bacterium]MDR7614225.1 CdaR family protein [Armatimonadota bacterium]